MNAPTSSAAAEKSLPVDSDVGAEMSKLVEEHPWMTTVIDKNRSPKLEPIREIPSGVLW
jgi:hypothetical protein